MVQSQTRVGCGLYGGVWLWVRNGSGGRGGGGTGDGCGSSNKSSILFGVLVVVVSGE